MRIARIDVDLGDSERRFERVRLYRIPAVGWPLKFDGLTCTINSVERMDHPELAGCEVYIRCRLQRDGHN